MSAGETCAMFLNSAIFYIVSLYFNLSSREISRHHVNITNIPNLVHENAPFCGQKAHFDVRSTKTPLFVDKKAHFDVRSTKTALFVDKT